MRLGSYEIVAAIGAGGMGEVYRARDIGLNRDVALKILPDAFAHDPDRLARFTREAQTLAAINHPNIAHIYGLERQEGREGQEGEDRAGTAFIVMELVDGEDLAHRIGRGPISFDEALPIARQIAEALEAAHELGIVHRDLKPANVRVRADGAVKVLDFGLAKAFDPAVSGAMAANVTHSPTFSVLATQAGIILGTAAYMAPEQAKGKPVDRRADIWAFGVVLFEMLTGRQLYAGETAAETLARVIERDPDLAALPADAPSAICDLLRRCLTKEPRNRLQAIGEARIVIEQTIAGAGSHAPSAPRTSAPSARATGVLSWSVAAASLVSVIALLAIWPPWRSLSSPAPIRVSAELGADVSLDTSRGTSLALSPDGSLLAFSGQRTSGGASQLYVRRLGQLAATPLPGTEGAFSPFFAPDGQWVAFFADGKLKKISINGGAAVTLCDAPNGRGGAWAEDNTIAFLPQNGPGVSLVRVSASGGKTDSLLTLAEGEVTQRWPQILPGGKAVLYSASSTPAGFEDGAITAQPLPAGARKILHRGGFYGRYLPSGHLVFIREGILFAAPFDLDRLEMTGPPVPVLEGIAASAGGGASGAAQFAVSGTGTMAYLAVGSDTRNSAPIQWLNRDGKLAPLRPTPAIWSSPRFAPDGRRIAIEIFDGRQFDIWTYEWARDTLSRLTFEATDDEKPVWTPDSRRVVFAHRGDKATYNLYWQRADGSGAAQRLTESPNEQLPASWHPNGRFLAFSETAPRTQSDVMILAIDGDEVSGWRPGKPTVFLNTPFAEIDPMFSPDGRWIAYASTETGRIEVYVRPFPGPGGKVQVSTDGGSYPMWSRTRRELLYGSLDRRIMAASYTAEGDSFRVDRPRPWSEGRYMVRPRQGSIDLHPDGERIALAAAPADQTAAKQDKVVFVFNFFDELRRLAPVGK